jgi:hypothetical protein
VEATLEVRTGGDPSCKPAAPDPPPGGPKELLEGGAPPGPPLPPPAIRPWIGELVAPGAGMTEADRPPPTIGLPAGNGSLGARPPMIGREPGGGGGDEEEPKDRAPSPFDPVCVVEVTLDVAEAMVCVTAFLTGARIFPVACAVGAMACVATLVTGATTLRAACVTGAAVCVTALLNGVTTPPVACATGAAACVTVLLTGVTTLPVACATGAAALLTLPSAPVTGPRALAWQANARHPNRPDRTAPATRRVIRVPEVRIEGW